jgi:hypothetical protein
VAWVWILNPVNQLSIEVLFCFIDTYYRFNQILNVNEYLLQKINIIKTSINKTLTVFVFGT